MYLGRHYRLKIIIGKKYNTEFKDGYLKITVKNKSNKQKIERLVKKWYLAHRSHAYQNLARITGSHLKVTGGVIIYNLIWVLPLTLWSALQPEMGVVAAICSIMPASIIAYKYGPKLSLS